MGMTVLEADYIASQLRELHALIEKGFEKEKDVQVEKDSVLKGITKVLKSSNAELMSIQQVSTHKDKFSAVLKHFQSKVADIAEL